MRYFFIDEPWRLAVASPSILRQRRREPFPEETMKRP
jgi:hypothetical protein